MQSRQLECLESRLLFAGDLPQLNLSGDTLEVPGEPGDLVTVEVRWTDRQASYY